MTPPSLRRRCAVPALPLLTVFPGAQRIAVNGGPSKGIAAFQNPDGSRVMVANNNTRQTISAVVDVAGMQVRLKISAKSTNMFLLR